MDSFLVAAGKDDSVLVVFREPVEIFTVGHDEFKELMLLLGKKIGEPLPAYPTVDIPVAGAMVFSASHTNVAMIRKALRKKQGV